MTDDEYKDAVDRIVHQLEVALIPFVPPKDEPNLLMIGNILSMLVHSTLGPPSWAKDRCWPLALEIASGLLCSEVGIPRRMNLYPWLDEVKYERTALLDAAEQARGIVEDLLREASK